MKVRDRQIGRTERILRAYFLQKATTLSSIRGFLSFILLPIGKDRDIPLAVSLILLSLILTTYTM